MHAYLGRPSVPALWLAVAALAVLWSGSPALAVEPGGDPALQGDWLVASAEQNGKPFDDIKGGRLTVSGTKFELLTASGNRLAGDLQVDAGKTPHHLDFLLPDGNRWLAIYTVSASRLRLNYVESEHGAARPTRFATAAGQPGTVIALRRP